MGDRRRDDDDSRDRRGRDDDRDGGRRSRDDDDAPRGGGRSRDRDDDRGSRDRGSPGYRYEKRDTESTRSRATKGNTDFDKFLKDGIKMFKPNDGDNRIRIVPPTWAKAEHYGYDIYVHYGVGADRQSYLDLHKHKDQPDPIHEAYMEAKNEFADDDKNEALKKHVKDLEAKRRVLVYLIDREHEKEGIQAWAMPWTLDRDIVQVMQDKRTGEVLPIDDPEDGYDVEFTKKGTKERTEYTGVAIARRSSQLNNDKAMQFAVDNPLPDQLVFFDYDHIAKEFGGRGARRGGRDEDREPSREERPREGDRSSRDRDDEPRGRSRDRDEDRGSRDRGSRDDDDAPRGGGRSRSRESDDDYTWDKIHDMTKTELEDLIEDKKLDIRPKDAKNVDDLADWVCEEMKIKAAKKEERRPSRDDDEGGDKLAEMRRRRERD